MKSSPKLIVAALGVLLLVFLLGRCSVGHDHDDPHAGHDHGDTTTAVAKAEVWTCSMHPQVRQPNFGTCPICAMDLILLADDGGDDDGDLPILRVSARAVALMQIRVAPVRRAEAPAEIRLDGRTAVDETRLRAVSARFPGRVEKLHVAFAGATLTAGTPLFDLYSPELLGAQEEFLQARRLHDQRPDDTGARLAAAAAEKLHLLGLSASQVEAIAARGSAADTLTYLAPFDGVVLARAVTTGDYVATGDPLFTAADLSTLWVNLEAYENDLAALRPGQEAEVRLAARPGETFAGVVTFIDPVLDEMKRTARVRIEIANTDGHLRPGLLATGLVRARLAADPPPLVIPATAPLHTGRRAVVYVQDPAAERPTFEARTITLGPRLGELYVVSEGLSEGDLVVVNGQFKIDSELQIRGRPSMMSAAAAETDAPAVPDPRDPPVPVALTATVDPAFSDELIPLLNAYLDLGERLADEDRAGARAAAAIIRTTLTAIGEHRLTGDAHVAWMEHYQSLDTPLAALPAAPSIADLRGQYQALTTALEVIYVTFGGGRLPPVLRAHCPMVDGGVVINGEPIGTWLQRTDLLANPYWGEVMLRCGDFHGELK